MTEPAGTDKRDSTHAAGAARHEQRDVHARPIALGIVGIVVVLAFVGLLMGLLLGQLREREAGRNPPPNALARQLGRQVPPEPRLQTQPVEDLARFHAEEDEILGTYGWVDRKAGLVRIPIDRAMQLILERGVAPWPSTGAEE